MGKSQRPTFAFPRKDDNGTAERQREPKLATLRGHAAFQRQFWRPNSHFSWAVASGDPPLVARIVRSYGRSRVLPHAALASPKARKLPAPGAPKTRVFLRRSCPMGEYFCTLTAQGPRISAPGERWPMGRRSTPLGPQWRPHRGREVASKPPVKRRPESADGLRDSHHSP
jgi:hypothetical protein